MNDELTTPAAEPASPGSTPEESTLRPRDLFLFLVGNRESIRRVVRSRWTLPIGVILVWTAGIARHYDFHPLLTTPKWLWAPFLVAASTSFLAFLFVYLGILGFSQRKGPNFFVQYLSFYGAFLMTAPIAWLYAVPVEHFLDADPLASARWNVALLAIVSLWRVGLIIRVIRVITRAPSWKIWFLVLLPLSCVTCLASISRSLDIVGLMGGAELTPAEEFRNSAYGFISVASFWIAVVCLIGACFPIGEENRGKGFFAFEGGSRPARALAAAGVVLLAWIAFSLPFQLDEKLREPRLSLEETAASHESEPPEPRAGE